MANAEHVAILRQGVEAWNAWREDNPDIIPNLTGMHLYYAELQGVNLCNALLAGVQLVGADLTKAILTGAYLELASLKGADLTGAHLDHAILVSASMQGANLWLASLRNANLVEANLTDACFGRTDVQGSSLKLAVLTKATGIIPIGSFGEDGQPAYSMYWPVLAEDKASPEFRHRPDQVMIFMGDQNPMTAAQFCSFLKQLGTDRAQAASMLQMTLQSLFAS